VEILEPNPEGVAVEVRSFERSQQVDFRTTHQSPRWWWFWILKFGFLGFQPLRL